MIIISGASRGIGNYLMQEFLKTGENVIGLYNNNRPKENEELFFNVDISSLQSIDCFVKTNSEKLNKIVLINCAGTNYNSFAHKADPKKWAQLISVNLVGTFYLINALLPQMRKQNYGRIINFSSVLAQIGIPGTSAYAASKAGLWGMTKAIAAENASKGITINNLNLGYFNIGMITDVPLDIQEQIISRIPSNKLGNKEEIYKAVSFLISAEYVNGTNIDINGGLY